MKKLVSILIGVVAVLFAMALVDHAFGILRGEWIYTYLMALALIAAIDFTLAVDDEIEKKQEIAVKGKTDAEWEFTDPEIEEMWNKTYSYVSRGLKPPKSIVSGKEDQ